MKRSIYKDLLRWKRNKLRKPLIIDGARQVGKTWVIKEFGKNEYKNVAYINCDRIVEMKILWMYGICSLQSMEVRLLREENSL